MVMVKKQKGESEDKLIARFRKKVLISGVILEYKDRERFKKKSQKRKEQKYRIKHQIEVEKKREAR
jgi:ribosomal protein S21